MSNAEQTNKPSAKNRNSKKSPSGKSSGNNGNNGNKKRNRRPRNNRNKSSTTKNLSGFEKIERAYLNLLEKHLEARKKYYDLFHRADPRQLSKLERSFSRTVIELREYEDNIKPEYKDRFEAKYNGLKLDHTYSSNHEISPDQEEVSTEGEFEDPHLLSVQKETSFVDDTEESMGSIEDYKKYKGL